MSTAAELAKLARTLSSKGPLKQEKTPRRVRGLLNGVFLFDTTSAYHIWEHEYYPQYYIPVGAFVADAHLRKGAAVEGTHNAVHFATIAVGGTVIDRVLIFETKALAGLVKIFSPDLDQWFEEDVPIYSSHPKDPYKRVDILPSSRRIKVALDGITLAETSSPLLLLETTLRTRYYLNPTSVDWTRLTRSDSVTYCPYKGEAHYYNVTVDGKTFRDVVWYYRYPTLECALIANYLCFYNERVDIWVDGVKETK